MKATHIGLYNLFFCCLLFRYSVIWILCSLNPCSPWICACLYQYCQNLHNISVHILCYLPNSAIIHGVQIGLLSFKVLSIVNQGKKNYFHVQFPALSFVFVSCKSYAFYGGVTWLSCQHGSFLRTQW